MVNQSGTMGTPEMDGDIGIYECQLFVCLFIRMSSQRVPDLLHTKTHPTIKSICPAKKQIDLGIILHIVMIYK